MVHECDHSECGSGSSGQVSVMHASCTQVTQLLVPITHLIVHVTQHYCDSVTQHYCDSKLSQAQKTQSVHCSVLDILGLLKFPFL
eukprot:1263685-Amphidinium_carterae.1